MVSGITIFILACTHIVVLIGGLLIGGAAGHDAERNRILNRFYLKERKMPLDARLKVWEKED